jgi:ATP-dependent DNA helicase RecG
LGEIATAARVLSGKKVAPCVRLIVIPASSRIYSEALEKGYIKTLIDAGAVIGSPACGACGGHDVGLLAEGNYSRVLFDHPEFDLETVFLIDKVQKHVPLEKEQLKRLRSLGVIEGKAPYVYISALIAEIIGEKVQYIRNKGFDDDYYKQMMIEYLTQFGSGKKKDFMGLLLSKLPDVLSEKQKEYKIQYLLKSLRSSGVIQLDSENPRTASWVLSKKD